MADELPDDGVSLREQQGSPLTGRDLIRPLMHEVVDLDAQVLVASLSNGGDIALVRPMELEVAGAAGSQVLVLWTVGQDHGPDAPGLTFAP